MKIRIVVCDDWPSVATILARMIEEVRPDATCTITHNSAEALQALQAPFDGVTALVTDYHLSDQYTGDDLIHNAAVGGYGHSRAAVISAVIGREGQEKTIGNKEVRYWAKPINLAVVTSLMAWLVPLDVAQPCP